MSGPGAGALTAFTRGVAEALEALPPLLSPAVSVREAVSAMRAARASTVLAVDAGGRIAGIFTEQDVARRAAYVLPPDCPLSMAMTSPVLTIAVDDYLYRAVARMHQLGLRHMPVVDANGHPVGMLGLAAALASASGRLLTQMERLTGDSSDSGLAGAKSAQADFAWELHEDAVPATTILGVISEINADLHRRVLVRCLAESPGPPPVDFSLLVMGSGGRRESFLRPDQDNGFILADYPDDEHGRVDPWFVDLAVRMTTLLDRIGFPLCQGNVMATNPLWRKSISQWVGQMELWGARRSPVALLYADIFLDFKSIWGDAAPAQRLRAAASRHLGRGTPFLAAMAAEGQRLGVALGWFGRVPTDGDGRVDLKLRGSMPLVASVRLYALRAGIDATGTLDRIHALAEEGTFGRDEADRLGDAFGQLSALLLRQQLLDHRAGRTPANHVELAMLTARERGHLVASLRAIDLLSRRARADFTGQVL